MQTNKPNPSAEALLRERVAAFMLGQPEWLTMASEDMRRYMQPVKPRSRRRCPCCKARATHMGMANGLALMEGCELRVRRWVKRALK